MSDATPPPDLLEGLNAEQRAAAAAGDGPLLVVAGAGTGKTRTLGYRVAHLVARGVAPESILLLTFTRQASREMLRRASALVGEGVHRVAGGTFHGFGHLVLRRHGGLLGYGEGFTILDRGDAADLVDVVRTELGCDRRGRRFPRKEALVDLFSRRVNTGRSLEDLVAAIYPQFGQELAAIAAVEARYAERKREQDVMDYDDLLVNLRRLLVEQPAVRAGVATTYRHVLVDEYQDTNRLQAHVAALLAAEHGNLVVVGDDAQSIYSFRGADFRNVLDFPKLFPDCRTVVLETCYRATQPILDLANAVLAAAREKVAKRLRSDVAGGTRPLFVRAADDAEQARWVAETVLELREEGVPLGEIAVLSRAAWHTGSLEIELARRGIPFRKFGGLKLTEAAHVKDVCAFLKVARNPRDTAGWFRILQLYEGIGPRTAERLAGQVLAAGGDVTVLTRPVVARQPYGPALAVVTELLERLADESAGVAERLRLVAEHYEPLARRRYDDAPRRLRDLEGIETIAERYADVDAFLADLSIEPPEVADRQGPVDRDETPMTVSTVHSAKGLEWHAVFVLDLVAGRFPVYASLDDPDAYEEERRLLYVALTRAKRRLFLTRPEEVTRRGGAIALAEMSPLLRDVAGFDDLVDTVHVAAKEPERSLADGEKSELAASRLRRIEDYFGS